MSKSFKSLIGIIISACVITTSSVFCALIVNLFTGQKAFQNETILEIILISFVGSIIQWFAFSEDVIRRLKYSYRNIIFVVPYFLMLSGAAYLFNWFDTTQLSYWISFTGIFILAYIVSSIAFLIYFRVTGQKYNEKLEEYKSNK